MGRTPCVSLPAQIILRALLEYPKREMFVLELCTVAGLQAGAIHPILARFEAMGWLESRWEDADIRQLNRPRRRLYRLSAEGAEQVSGLLTQGAPVPRRAWSSSRPALPGAMS